MFFEAHDPTQGMRQNSGVGTQYRSAIFALRTPSDVIAEELAAPQFADAYAQAWLRTDHHRDHRRRAVLLYELITSSTC